MADGAPSREAGRAPHGGDGGGAAAALATRPRGTDARALHEADEHLWIAGQAAALRAGRLADLDADTLAEFLDDVAGRDRRELESRLAVLIAHILEARHQPERHGGSWTSTIREQQRQLRRMLRMTPSLRRFAEGEALAQAWPDGVEIASDETGLPGATFPAAPDLSLDGALAFDAAPARRGDHAP